jgi:hypothetical protein
MSKQSLSASVTAMVERQPRAPLGFVIGASTYLLGLAGMLEHPSNPVMYFNLAAFASLATGILVGLMALYWKRLGGPEITGRTMIIATMIGFIWYCACLINRGEYTYITTPNSVMLAVVFGLTMIEPTVYWLRGLRQAPQTNSGTK